MALTSLVLSKFQELPQFFSFYNEINVYLDYLKWIYLKGETFPEFLRCDRFLSEKMQHTEHLSDDVE